MKNILSIWFYIDLKIFPLIMHEKVSHLLGLGCGTGLELGGIFGRFPDICVTGVDIAQKMLDALNENTAIKIINLVCKDYFE